MKKILSNILFIIYVVVAIFITVCLLSYNDFKVTEFGDTSLVIIPDDELAPEYNKGDLLIVRRARKINAGENVFFYNTYNSRIEISLGTIVGAEEVTTTETTYVLEGERKISSEYVLGPESTITKIEGVGTVLSILESKWGFLFIIVLPALLMFIYQISVVFSEIREAKKESANEGKNS